MTQCYLKQCLPTDLKQDLPRDLAENLQAKEKNSNESLVQDIGYRNIEENELCPAK